MLHLYTNVISKINKIQVILPYYGKERYYYKAIANILSFTNLLNKYRVVYDSHQYYLFDFHTNIWIIKLRRNKQGLYVFKPTYSTANSNVVTTVKENIVVVTSRQIDRAKLDRKIYSILGLPTVRNFKHMVSANMISNCAIALAYTINSKYIYMGHQWKVWKASLQETNQGK